MLLWALGCLYLFSWESSPDTCLGVRLQDHMPLPAPRAPWFPLADLAPLRYLTSELPLASQHWDSSVFPCAPSPHKHRQFNVVERSGQGQAVLWLLKFRQLEGPLRLRNRIQNYRYKWSSGPQKDLELMRRAEAEAVPTLTNPSQGLHSSPNPSTTTLQPEQSLSLSKLSSLLVQVRGLGGERVGELCSPSQPWNSELYQPWSKHFPRLPATSQNCPWSGRDATPPSSPKHILYYSNESLACFKYHKTKTTAALVHHHSLPRPQRRAPPDPHQGRDGEQSPHSPFQESIGPCLEQKSLVAEVVKSQSEGEPTRSLWDTEALRWSEAGGQGPGSTTAKLVPSLRLQEPRSLTSGRAREVQPKVSAEGGSSPPGSWEASAEQKSKHSSERKEPWGCGGDFLPQGSPKPKDKSSGEPGRPYKVHS